LAVKANLIQELPVQNDLVSIILLPLTLAFIMFALGLGLALADFKRIFTQPRALLVGAVCHFLLLPLACHLLLDWWGISGAFAVGFMILAACPTGSTSNLLTYLARGDVALALSFTAVASVLTIFTLPLIVTWALGHYLGAARAVDVPVGLMMGQVALVLGVPVSLGMLARQRWPAWARRFESRATRIATLLFLLIVVLAVLKKLCAGAQPYRLAGAVCADAESGHAGDWFWYGLAGPPVAQPGNHARHRNRGTKRGAGAGDCQLGAERRRDGHPRCLVWCDHVRWRAAVCADGAPLCARAGLCRGASPD
jgi:hypothetical protein